MFTNYLPAGSDPWFFNALVRAARTIRHLDMSAREYQNPAMTGPRQARSDCRGAEVSRNGGFAYNLPEDAWHAVEVCREQDQAVSCRVQLRLEPEYPGAPRRQQPPKGPTAHG